MTAPQSRVPAGTPPIVWAIALTMCAVELAFVLAERSILPYPDLRFEAYLHLAFWDLYFEAARGGEDVPGWFWGSFLTHALVHGSVMHVALNAVIFLALGRVLAIVLGPVRFLCLIAMTAIAGALAFGLIAESRGPMVGASGVVFGFFGALKAWEWRWIRATGAPANRFWGTIIGLTVMNVILFFAFPGEGSLAWQAHLGGFLAGFVLAPILAPDAAGPSPI